MIKILSIETSTSVCSVAVHGDGKLLSVMEVHQEYSHASKLGTLVENVLNLTDVKENELAAVAVSAGPGSYTGLRIGTSLAKGIGYALSIPLIAVPTLQVLANKVKKIHAVDAFLCPMIDARRMEVYCEVFDFTLEVVEPVKALVIDENSFQDYLETKSVIFFGNGAMKCSTVIKHRNAKFLDDVTPSAIELGELAFQKFKLRQHEDIEEFVPEYLKDFFIRKPVENLNKIN